MDYSFLKEILCETGLRICRRVHHSLHTQSLEERAAVHSESSDDTIYQIDRDVEDLLIEEIETHAEELGGVVLVAEGLEREGELYTAPNSIDPADAAWRILMDPIDGTRGIMYDKRSAFYLAGAAPNRGESTTIQDIELAVMVEIPTSRSYLSDTLWAIKGEGARRFTHDLKTGAVKPRSITPSTSSTILGGFAQISRFFPPGRNILAQIDEEIIQTLFPNAPEGRAILFEDQYISTGGQFYEMLIGHDRFNADLRASLYRRMRGDGFTAGAYMSPLRYLRPTYRRRGGIAHYRDRWRSS